MHKNAMTGEHATENCIKLNVRGRRGSSEINFRERGEYKNDDMPHTLFLFEWDSTEQKPVCGVAVQFLSTHTARQQLTKLR